MKDDKNKTETVNPTTGEINNNDMEVIKVFYVSDFFDNIKQYNKITGKALKPNQTIDGGTILGVINRVQITNDTYGNPVANLSGNFQCLMPDGTKKTSAKLKINESLLGLTLSNYEENKNSKITQVLTFKIKLSINLVYSDDSKTGYIYISDCKSNFTQNNFFNNDNFLES